jgi:hypothetical protein
MTTDPGPGIGRLPRNFRPGSVLSAPGEHTYARATRDDGYMRMECCCGKRSRWSAEADIVRFAADRHAYEATGALGTRWVSPSGHDKRRPS